MTRLSLLLATAALCLATASFAATMPGDTVTGKPKICPMIAKVCPKGRHSYTDPKTCALSCVPDKCTLMAKVCPKGSHLESNAVTCVQTCVVDKVTPPQPPKNTSNTVRGM